MRRTKVVVRPDRVTRSAAVVQQVNALVTGTSPRDRRPLGDPKPRLPITNRIGVADWGAELEEA